MTSDEIRIYMYMISSIYGRILHGFRFQWIKDSIFTRFIFCLHSKPHDKLQVPKTGDQNLRKIDKYDT